MNAAPLPPVLDAQAMSTAAILRWNRQPTPASGNLSLLCAASVRYWLWESEALKVERSGSSHARDLSSIKTFVRERKQPGESRHRFLPADRSDADASAAAWGRSGRSGCASGLASMANDFVHDGAATKLPMEQRSQEIANASVRT